MNAKLKNKFIYMNVVEILTGESLSRFSCVLHKRSSTHPPLRITPRHVRFRNRAFTVCVGCYWRRGSQSSAMELMRVLSGDQTVCLIVTVPFIFQPLLHNEKGV